MTLKEKCLKVAAQTGKFIEEHKLATNAEVRIRIWPDDNRNGKYAASTTCMAKNYTKPLKEILELTEKYPGGISIKVFGPTIEDFNIDTNEIEDEVA